MRIRINGEEIQGPVDRVQFETRQASTFAAWVVILVGTAAAIVWYFIWI